MKVSVLFDGTIVVCSVVESFVVVGLLVCV